MKKSLFITFYDREKIFLNNLKYLKKCKMYNEYEKLVVYQNAKKEIIKKIRKIDPNIKVIKTNYSKNYSTYSKVNNNIYLGFSYCFNVFKSDYSIHIEDDITPAYDFLVFVNYIMKKYKNDKYFFGVNGFSKEVLNVSKFTYSKYIYGIGKGWCISKSRFSEIKYKFKTILNKNAKRFFDVYFEFLVKRKYFVIMPYRSRTLEQISSGLTMQKNFQLSLFYRDWKKSFLGNKKFPIKGYTYERHLPYNWRYDCLKLTKINRIISMILFLFTKVYYFILKLIK